MMIRYILYANGRKWGAYLTLEHAEEVAERLRRKAMKVKIMRGAEGWSEA
jgi:hypothetical protein